MMHYSSGKQQSLLMLPLAIAKKKKEKAFFLLQFENNKKVCRHLELSSVSHKQTPCAIFVWTFHLPSLVCSGIKSHFWPY